MTIREIKNKKGISYKVEIERKVHEPVYGTFDRKRDAVNFEAITLAAILEGRNVLTCKKRKMTVHEFFKEYKQIIDRKNICQSTKNDYFLAFDFFDKQISRLYVCNCNYNTIKGAVNELLTSEKVIKGSKTCKPKTGRRISNNTFNHKINYVSSAFNYDLKKLNIIQFNPFDAVDRLDIVKKKHKIVTPYEINLLLTEFRNHSEKLYMIKDHYLLGSYESLIDGIANYYLDNKKFPDIKTLQLEYRDTRSISITITDDEFSMQIYDSLMLCRYLMTVD